MSAEAYNIGATLFYILTWIVPIYFIFMKSRFWFAFLSCWFFLIATEQCSVSYGWIIYFEGLRSDEPADYTNVGIIMFAGWLFALPYCGILKLIHYLLVRFGIMKPIKVAQKSKTQPASTPPLP